MNKSKYINQGRKHAPNNLEPPVPGKDFYMPEQKHFAKLETLNRPTVSTAEAAYYLMRKPQTLLIWACKQNGPIQPTRINGRLAWHVVEIKKLLGC